MSEQENDTTPPDEATPVAAALPGEESLSMSQRRRLLMITATAVFVVIALVYGLYWVLVACHYQETDNAYVNGNIIPVSAQIDGTIIRVDVDDTQFVRTGQILVKLDPVDASMALLEAGANLAQVLRSTQQLYINNNGLQANIIDRQVAYDKAKKDLLRRDQAIGLGAISQEELIHAQDLLKSTTASLTQAQTALQANQAMTFNTPLEQHPYVLAAAAKLRQAYINFLRTTIRAPVSGEVSRRTAQVGQSIRAGSPLMALIPLEQVWVDANFKEKQVRNMRIGQPVVLTADLYGSSVQYHGRIMGFSAGTGSAFALLPAQNATGNWIKVVQRLPVRVALDAAELKAHPLRIGLSMEVEVDTRDRSGKLISDASAAAPVYQTDVYKEMNELADKEVARVVTKELDNLHKASLNSVTPP